jgi:hypothetical protein
MRGIAAAIASFLIVGSGVRQNSTDNQAPVRLASAGMTFAISTDGNTYSVQRSTIDVHYRIDNVRGAAVFVPRVNTLCFDRVRYPHVQAWLEDGDGAGTYRQGYGASCSGTPVRTLDRVATRLEPGQHVDESLQVAVASFHLSPGSFRIAATLDGWPEGAFSDRELGDGGTTFLVGQLAAKLDVTLTP